MTGRGTVAWPGAAALLIVAVLLAGCTTAPPAEGPRGPAAPVPGNAGPEPVEPGGSLAERPDDDGTERREPPVAHLSGEAHNWRGDLARTGWTPGVVVPDSVHLDWRQVGYNKGKHTAAKGSALLVDDVLLAAADTGALYALTLDGDVLWAAATWPSGFGIHGTPSVWNGTVYIGAYDGAMYAYDLDDGQLLWRTPIGGSIGASPLVHEGLVYISVETPVPSGIMAVLDAGTGQELWRDDGLGDHPHSSVAIDLATDTMVVGANDGVLYAWNATSFEPRWTFETGGAIKGPITIVDSAAVFGSWDHSVYRVNLVTGALDWRYETGDKVMSGAGYDPQTHTVFIGSHDEHLHALDAATGEPHWRFETDGWITSSPTLTENAVLFGSYDEHLYALDKETGQQLWRFETRGRLTSSPMVWADGVAVLDRADEGTGSLWVLAWS